VRPSRKPGDPLRGLYRAAAFDNSAHHDALIEGVCFGGCAASYWWPPTAAAAASGCCAASLAPF
jgi:hypothetical protein